MSPVNDAFLVIPRLGAAENPEGRAVSWNAPPSLSAFRIDGLGGVRNDVSNARRTGS